MANHAITVNAARLVPALIGRLTVHIECPAWCIVDHVAEAAAFAEDIVHATATSSIAATSMVSRGIVAELYTTVKADPSSDDPRLRAAHVVVDKGAGKDACMTPELAEAFADELIGFASEVRRLARIASLANGPVDPAVSMDEALRQVRSA